MDALKADVAQAKHDLDVKSAEKHAERLEWEADFAIDYAIASGLVGFRYQKRRLLAALRSGSARDMR